MRDEIGFWYVFWVIFGSCLAAAATSALDGNIPGTLGWLVAAYWYQRWKRLYGE